MPSDGFTIKMEQFISMSLATTVALDPVKPFKAV
jgi:hypothetical protein